MRLDESEIWGLYMESKKVGKKKNDAEKKEKNDKKEEGKGKSKKGKIPPQFLKNIKKKKAIKEDMTAKAKTLQEEMMKETEGKSQEEAQKVVQDKSAKMQVIQTEAQNKLKTSFETAAGEVAKEKKLGAILVKEAVPQGGVDVTDDILKKMK